jgi:hypothetical protein
LCLKHAEYNASKRDLLNYDILNSLNLKLAEFPQNETIFDRIIAEFLVKIASILNILSTGQLILELVTHASELFTRGSVLVTRAIFVGPAPFLLDPRHFCWTRAIFAGPVPFLLTRDPRHIDYPIIII